jgi:mRNA-degrading endonuclease toxin of MazEF toxin-antitoxin module
MPTKPKSVRPKSAAERNARSARAAGETGLHSVSQIMTDKITAVRRDRIRCVLGSLRAVDVERLDRAILITLGLVTS